MLATTPICTHWLASTRFARCSPHPSTSRCRRDYDKKSREFFAKSYRPPADLSFADSPALFPEGNLRDQLAAEFETQCRLLFSDDGYPPFDEVLARFEEIRELL
jgi:hypothetical protein